MSNNHSGFLSPAIFFTFDPSNNGFNRNCILDTLQSESIDVEVFQDFLIRSIEKKENILKGENRSNLNNNNFNTTANNRTEYSGFIGNAEILEQQRREMENILREEERQKKLKAEEEKKKLKEVNILFQNIKSYEY